MKIARFGILSLALLLVVGCAGGAKKINLLQLGMTRAQVVEVMGEPNSTSEIDGTLYLRYYLSPTGLFSEEYFVRIVEDAVDAYGRRGDFGLGY
jgi:hypothetical protein